MNFRRNILLIALFAFVSACSNFRTYTPEDRRSRLEDRQILSYLKNIEGTHLAIGEAQAIIDAPPRRVWNAVTDYNRQGEIGPHTKKIQITRVEGDTCWVDLILNAPWPLRDAEFTLKVDHDKRALRTNWSLVEGNIKQSYGSWDVDPLPSDPNRSLVTYTLLYDDGRPVPRWMVNSLTRQGVHKIMKLLRDHVHDPIYDKPVYSISVLDSSPSSNASTELGAAGEAGKSGGSTDLKFDEETLEILR